MKKYIVVSIVAFTLFFLGGVFSFRNLNLVSAGDDKVKICHSHDSQTNPYNTENPDKSGDVSGHDGHNGPVWYSGIADHSWGDIIPPFEYCPSDSNAYTSTDNSKSCTKKIRSVDMYADALSYTGKNWNSNGQATWNNNCVVPSATATSTATATATSTATATAVPTSTPTSSPTVSPTATPTEDPCIENDDCDDSTPTPTASPEPTATPNNGDVCANIEGIQTSLPDNTYHFDVTGRNCLQFSVPGVEQPTGGANISQPQVLGASTIGGGKVLGASTMAKTGVVEDAIFNSIFTLGSLLTSFGIMKNGKKKA